MQGIEMVKDPETKEPCDKAAMSVILGDLFSRGVIVAPAGRWGNTLRFMPPLTIKKDHFIKATEIVIDAVKSRRDELSGKKSG